MFCLIFFDDRKTVKYMKSSGKTKRITKKKNDRSRFPTIEKYMRGDSLRRRYKLSTLFLNTKPNPRRKK